MAKVGLFDNKSGHGNKLTKTKRVGTKYKKKGTANTVEEDNGKETEVKDDDLFTREHLLWMRGMSNTLVGNVSDIKEPATKSMGC